MKIRTYGALTSALLISLSVGAAQAANCAACACPPQSKAAHRAAARPAPARVVRRHRADAEAHVKSFYDYNSARAVSEVLARQLESSLPQPWEIAPNDAHIRFRPYNTGTGYASRDVVALNDNDFNSGGVGNTGGAGSGYMDGYGQMHYYSGGVGENGPSYNNYDESFSTGGFAQDSHGTERSSIWHGYSPVGPKSGY